MALVYPAHHHIVIARELTKLYETILTGPLDTLLAHVETDENMRKGEFVVIVKGADVKPAAGELTEEQANILAVLMQECSTKTAIELAVKLTGVRKKLLYQAAIAIEKETAQR
jgi:16S rRNA (cytidine1402-2'-O)-methyltransferase